MHATRLGARLGMDRLYSKDESLNPTNSFKARGQSAAITRAMGLGMITAADAVKAGLRAEVFLPKDVKEPFARECILYGAGVTLVDGVRTGRADGLALSRLDSLSDRRRHRHGREVEGVRRDGSHRLGRAASDGGAALAARERLLTAGTITPHESVVLFNTGGALTYLDALPLG